jgi:F-type H+-transporting ATPase subunit gamma
MLRSLVLALFLPLTRELTNTGEANDATMLFSIGDKGRAQLARSESKRFSLCFQDTYKVKVTFSQVCCLLALLAHREQTNLHLPSQASSIAEELMKHNPQAVQILFNKFRSAISFKPTIATILTAEVRVRV